VERDRGLELVGPEAEPDVVARAQLVPPGRR
jgi:hypothetical protein